MFFGWISSAIKQILFSPFSFRTILFSAPLSCPGGGSPLGHVEIFVVHISWRHKIITKFQHMQNLINPILHLPWFLLAPTYSFRGWLPLRTGHAPSLSWSVDREWTMSTLKHSVHTGRRSVGDLRTLVKWCSVCGISSMLKALCMAASARDTSNSRH